MVENLSWFIYAILASLLTGIFSFLTKVQSESLVDDFYFYLSIYTAFIFTSLALAIYFFGKIEYTFNTILFAFLMSSTFFLSLKTRFISLKYLSSATYFINYRIVSSWLLVFAGSLFFLRNLILMIILDF